MRVVAGAMYFCIAWIAVRAVGWIVGGFFRPAKYLSQLQTENKAGKISV
jgi:hypothetical protein